MLSTSHTIAWAVFVRRRATGLTGPYVLSTSHTIARAEFVRGLVIAAQVMG